MALQDLKKTALIALGYSGDAVDSNEMNYYLANGATTRNHRQAQLEMLAVQGFSEGSLEDRWNAYLISLGYTGSLQDKLNALWAAGGPSFGGGATDPYWANVVSLLWLNEVAGSTSPVDQKGKVWTVEGTGCQITASNQWNGNNSLTTNGGLGRLTSPDSDDWHTGAGDYTIECFIRPNSWSVSGVVGQWDNPSSARSFFMGTAAGGTGAYLQGAATSIFPAGFPSTGAWHHLALSRTGANTNVCLDGTIRGTHTTGYTNPNTSSKIELNTLNYPYSGQIANFRFTKGVGRYPSAYTAPTELFPNS